MTLSQLLQATCGIALVGLKLLRKDQQNRHARFMCMGKRWICLKSKRAVTMHPSSDVRLHQFISPLLMRFVRLMCPMLWPYVEAWHRGAVAKFYLVLQNASLPQMQAPPPPEFKSSIFKKNLVGAAFGSAVYNNGLSIIFTSLDVMYPHP